MDTAARSAHERNSNRLRRTFVLFELKANLNLYLANAAAEVQTRTLADTIRFNQIEAQREMPFFDQELFERAEATEGLDVEEYRTAAAQNRRLAGPEGIDRMLRELRLDALIAPTTGPAWSTDVVNGNRSLGSASRLPAVAGYPHLTVPMGQIHGLPVGISFIGLAWTEARLLAFGHAFEQLTQARRPPTFAPSIDGFDSVAPRIAPAAATGKLE